MGPYIVMDIFMPGQLPVMFFKVERYLLDFGNFRERDLMVIELDSAVRVDGSFFSQAEDIFGGRIRGGQREGTEEGSTAASCFFKADVRYLASGGVKTLMVIAKDFFF